LGFHTILLVLAHRNTNNTSSLQEFLPEMSMHVDFLVGSLSRRLQERNRYLDQLWKQVLTLQELLGQQA
jgi:hypothetical protein